MLGIAWPLNLTAYTTGGRNPTFMPSLSITDNSDEPFLTWINYVLGQPEEEVPQVISTSYGDDEQTASKAYE
jgi:tripeptidyl-peptidase-1